MTKEQVIQKLTAEGVPFDDIKGLSYHELVAKANGKDKDTGSKGSKATPKAKAAEGGDSGEDIVTLTIQPDANGYAAPVPINYSGERVVVPRGVPVQIKRKFVTVLEEAIEETPVTTIDENGMPRITSFQQRQRFHFSVSG